MKHQGQRHIVIPVFVPHKGCPFDCIYCNQKSISGQTEEMTEQKMKSIVNSYLETADRDAFVEIGFYGGSFTGIEKSRQLALLSAAYSYLAEGRVSEVRLSTRPDFITEDILQYLKKYGVRTIELGVQSMDDTVLKESCRGHNVYDVITSSCLIREFGFKLGLQTMLGLPGDCREKVFRTAEEIIRLKPDLVRIYPTLVIRGTYLEKMYYEGIYKPLDLEEAVELCTGLVPMYRRNGIRVTRVGLQTTENIREGGDIIAGPYHPAFGQLVEARVMLGLLRRIIDESCLYNHRGIVIYTGAGNISNVVGNKKANITYLKAKYGFSRILVKSKDIEDKNLIIAPLP